jgi:hypothetical protein
LLHREALLTLVTLIVEAPGEAAYGQDVLNFVLAKGNLTSLGWECQFTASHSGGLTAAENVASHG